MNLTWDYTTLAATYDDRADYDKELIKETIQYQGLIADDTVLDLGAGTGKLTKELVANGLKVIASEPNDAMRTIGTRNVPDQRCNWISSPAEKVEVPTSSVSSTWFGSSFNVINHELAFVEFRRYSKPGSWLTCLWNHRDLEDPIQKSIEEIFKKEIPGYSYGSRRQDPTEVILQSGLFGKVESFSGSFEVTMSKDAYVAAWKSHGTLLRQSKSQSHFETIIKMISDRLADLEFLTVPYSTKLWTATKSVN